jgi:hypothetical protein
MSAAVGPVPGSEIVHQPVVALLDRPGADPVRLEPRQTVTTDRLVITPRKRSVEEFRVVIDVDVVPHSFTGNTALALVRLRRQLLQIGHPLGKALEIRWQIGNGIPVDQPVHGVSPAPAGCRRQEERRPEDGQGDEGPANPAGIPAARRAYNG